MSTPFIGEIKMFAGTFAPRGYALCDGQLLAVSQNDALFSLLGTTYGGDGRTTFGLPDLRGRVPIHAGSGPGLTPRHLGVKTGAENVTLTTQQIPSHTHTLTASTAAGGESSPNNAQPAQSTSAVYLKDPIAMAVVDLDNPSIAPVGGSQQHTNMQPFQCINFIIALQGIYPSRS